MMKLVFTTLMGFGVFYHTGKMFEVSDWLTQAALAAIAFCGYMFGVHAYVEEKHK